MKHSRPWRVTVYEPAGPTNRVWAVGVVEGPWASAVEVQAETIFRAVAAYGYHKVGHLRAHAQLVTP